MKLIISILISLSLAFNFLARQITVEQKELAKKYILFARVPYCELNLIRNNTCGACKGIEGFGHKHEFSLSVPITKEGKAVNIQTVILKNNNETVVSFSGPKSEDIKFLSSMYSKGLIARTELGGLLIEEEYWNIYQFLRQPVINQLKKIVAKGGKVIFTGHSFGGALASLAAYDAVYSKVITDKSIGPYVYLFAPLKIGGRGFLQEVQKFVQIPVVKIRKKTDFFTMIPKCIYVEGENRFKCFITPESLLKVFPKMKPYFETRKDANSTITQMPVKPNTDKTLLAKKIEEKRDNKITAIQPTPATKTPETKPTTATKTPETKPTTATKTPETNPTPATKKVETKPTPATKTAETKPTPATKKVATTPTTETKQAETKPTTPIRKTESKPTTPVRQTPTKPAEKSKKLETKPTKKDETKPKKVATKKAETKPPQENKKAKVMPQKKPKVENKVPARKSTPQVAKNKAQSEKLINVAENIIAQMKKNLKPVKGKQKTPKTNSKKKSKKKPSRTEDKKDSTSVSFVEKRITRYTSQSESQIRQLTDDKENCESIDDYIACKFNPNIHKLFWGLNMESC